MIIADRQIIVGFLIIEIYGIVNSLPAIQSTQVFQPEQTASTEKAIFTSSTIKSEPKADKVIPIVQSPSATENVSSGPSEHEKETVTVKTINDTRHSKTLGSASLLSKENEQKTLNLQKELSNELTTVLPTGHKVSTIITSPSNFKVEPTTVLPPVQRGEVTTASLSGTKGQSTAKPKETNKKGQTSRTDQKSTKTSTNYINKGKVVIFNGICGPGGCEIEGDVYDELVPITKPQQQ